MQEKHNIIGISGVAGCGKDTFFSLLSRKRDFRRLALADELKAEIRDELINDYNIDVLSCSREEKEVVRPRLVEFAKKMRLESKGRHWVNKLIPKISGLDHDLCITDIRYDDYENDEVYWLKEEMKGVLVHISMYEEIRNVKIFMGAPNAEEARNDPKIKKKADYRVAWPKLPTGTSKRSLEKSLEGYATQFLNWMDTYEKAKR